VAWRDWKTGERGTEREKSLSDEAMLGGVVEGCASQLTLGTSVRVENIEAEVLVACGAKKEGVRLSERDAVHVQCCLVLRYDAVIGELSWVALGWMRVRIRCGGGAMSRSRCDRFKFCEPWIV
jgi:hypothetical protein